MIFHNVDHHNHHKSLSLLHDDFHEHYDKDDAHDHGCNHFNDLLPSMLMIKHTYICNIILFHLHGIHLARVGLTTAVHLAEPAPTNDSETMLLT